MGSRSLALLGWHSSFVQLLPSGSCFTHVQGEIKAIVHVKGMTQPWF